MTANIIMHEIEMLVWLLHSYLPEGILLQMKSYENFKRWAVFIVSVILKI